MLCLGSVRLSPPVYWYSLVRSPKPHQIALKGSPSSQRMVKERMSWDWVVPRVTLKCVSAIHSELLVSRLISDLSLVQWQKWWVVAKSRGSSTRHVDFILDWMIPESSYFTEDNPRFRDGKLQLITGRNKSKGKNATSQIPGSCWHRYVCVCVY